MAMTTGNFPIVDAHQHFWDLSLAKHPWLMGPPIPFRYGDYTALRNSYLLEDYRADWGTHEIVQSVYVETEWDARDPVGETQWVTQYAAQHGLPSGVVAQAWLNRADVFFYLADWTHW